MIPEFARIADLIHQGQDIDAISNDVLRREKYATSKRQFQELSKRIRTLTHLQIEILAKGDPDEQKKMTHLALCKTYELYHDFVTDVLNEKIQVFDRTVTDLDYNSFISRKKVDHPELDELAQSTQLKVKTVIFRMLEQTGMIDSVSNSAILPQYLAMNLENAVIMDHPKWLACFMYSEHQIQSLV